MTETFTLLFLSFLSYSDYLTLLFIMGCRSTTLVEILWVVGEAISLHLKQKRDDFYHPLASSFYIK